MLEGKVFDQSSWILLIFFYVAASHTRDSVGRGVLYGARRLARIAGKKAGSCPSRVVSR